MDANKRDEILKKYWDMVEKLVEPLEEKDIELNKFYEKKLKEYRDQPENISELDDLKERVKKSGEELENVWHMLRDFENDLEDIMSDSENTVSITGVNYEYIHGTIGVLKDEGDYVRVQSCLDNHIEILIKDDKVYQVNGNYIADIIEKPNA